MVQGENVVDNMEKHDNNQLPLRAVSMYAVRTSIKDNERMKELRLRAKVICWRQYQQ